MLSKNLKHASDGVETQPETVIAQISDLHFTSRTSHDDFEWRLLSTDLKRLTPKVNLLVVTGDLIDGGFGKDEATRAFKNVYDYLHKLCKELGLDPQERLVVVPGNHDYRFKGLIRQRVNSEKFLDVFKDHYRPVLIRSLGVCVLVLDSNALEKRVINLATGMVEKNDLVAFSDFVKELHEKHAEELNSCIKIVLLHHHPMPIAASEGSGLLDQPGFLLLKNAGQFMTSMVDSKIDLILHGHQHYPVLAKASYPNGNGAEHSITIIGAGSVAHKHDSHERSYNVITITPNREIYSERRVITGLVYTSALQTPIRTFGDARQRRFEALARTIPAKIRARKFSRSYVIKSGSGDADLYEGLEEATAYSEKVAKFDTALYSDSGAFHTPIYKCSGGQNIRWVWKSADFTPSRREASVIFDPPLTKDHPISYEMRRKSYNLFHFNQQERSDATNGDYTQEYIELLVQNAYDLLVLTVVFPEGQWPLEFYSVVHDNKCFGRDHGESCTRDLDEEEHFNFRCSKFEDANTMVVSIARPLPGYTYWLYWTLPRTEYEPEYSATDVGNAINLVNKLLKLREPGNLEAPKINTWFETMLKDVITSNVWTSEDGDDELEISLYVYDPDFKGLVCVATSFGTCWPNVIKSGRTLIGAAYRRREHLLYSPLKNVSSSRGFANTLEYLNRVPEDWRASAGNPYIAICAIPIFLPIKKGFRIGVVTFSTRSANSRLLHFVPQRSTTDEVEAAGESLVDDVKQRQTSRLAAAFNTKSSA